VTEEHSIWARLHDLLVSVTTLGALSAHHDPTKTTTFTIGVIALAAKIAKADGQVSVSEVQMFRSIFKVEPRDEARVAQIYDLFRQDVAAYDVYARQLRRLFDHDTSALKDILDALFAIAMADGQFHEKEENFLRHCAEIFDVSPGCYAEMMARWVPERWNPHQVLGMIPGDAPEDIRRRYRQLVRESHPDRLIAKGMPHEMVGLATRRMADINRAYAEISAD
jgi:DnaJ like chaperone protein